MRRTSLISFLTLAPMFWGGCITTQDMGTEDSGAGGGNESSSDGGGSQGDDVGDGVEGGESTSGSESTSGNAESGDDDPGTASDDAGSTEGETGSDGSMLCEDTGGVWDPTACGHTQCGLPDICKAMIPGCDCGPNLTFDEALGCVVDEACDDTGDGAATLCAETGGTWDMGACGHYQCGVPSECEAAIPGCDCGPTQNFDNALGCADDRRCGDGLFACGDALECAIDDQYCDVLHPGPKGPSDYQCIDMPAACAATPDCDCLQNEGIIGPADCSDLPQGGVVVELSAP